MPSTPSDRAEYLDPFAADCLPRSSFTRLVGYRFLAFGSDNRADALEVTYAQLWARAQAVADMLGRARNPGDTAIIACPPGPSIWPRSSAVTSRATAASRWAAPVSAEIAVPTSTLLYTASVRPR